MHAGSSIMARTSSWARNSPRGQLLRVGIAVLIELHPLHGFVVKRKSRRTSLPGRGAHFYSRPTPPLACGEASGGVGTPPLACGGHPPAVRGLRNSRQRADFAPKVVKSWLKVQYLGESDQSQGSCSSKG